jgi:hypothetical protein
MARKARKASPTRRLLEMLRNVGCDSVDIVEHWSPFPRPYGRRVDLFGFVDVVALMRGHVLFIQVTSASCVSARRRKIEGIEHARRSVDSGVIVVVCGTRPDKTCRWQRFHSDGSWSKPYATILSLLSEVSDEANKAAEKVPKGESRK